MLIYRTPGPWHNVTMPRTARVLFSLIGCICLTLLMFEAGARLLWGSAREVLAIYQPDAALGVRLRPLATATLRTRTGRQSEVHTGPDGFRRGPDCATPTGRSRVLLLGDSQVFGYHMDEAETLAAQLGRALGPRHEVKSLAVPTYGPFEYVAVLRAHLATCQPGAVWWVVNEANDHHEATSRNRDRVTAEAGYARRAGAAEKTGLSAALMSLSGHSAAAYRGWRALSAARALLAGPNAVALSFAASRPDAEVDASTDATLAHIETARALCRAAGCTLYVAILPPDVLVDEGEAHKYARPPQATGLSRYSRALGEKLAGRGPVIHLGDTLRAHSPGAFLPDDPHLSPAGQRAVAEAMARAMAGHQHRTVTLSKEGQG